MHFIHKFELYSMKTTILAISIILFSNSGFGQQLLGKWKWENKDLSGEVFIGKGTYLIKVFVKDTDIKVSESFSFYQQRGDTLVFSDISFDSNPTELGYYLIKQLNEEQNETL